MLRKLSRWLWLLLVLIPGLARGEDRWSLLKIGMTTEETVKALGEPLARSNGRGFERWIYDNRAEVLFFGDLIGWSSPALGPVLGHSTDIWQLNGGKDDFRAVLLLLPPPKPKPKRLRPRVDPDAGDFEWRPALRFRP